MSEPGGWTTPEGWGPPPPASGPAAGGAPAHGGAPAYGGVPVPGPYGAADVAPGVVPLRPLGLGELLDGAVGVVRRYPRPTLGFAAAVAVVAAVVHAVLLVTAFRPLLDLDAAQALAAGSPEAVEAALGTAALGGLLTGALTLLTTAVLTGVLTVVVGKAVLGQPLDLPTAWAQVRPHLLRLVLLAVLLAVITGGVALAGIVVAGVLVAVGGAALALLGVPIALAGMVAAVYVYIRLVLAPCVLVLERVGVVASLRRSAVLVKGDWWRVFGISLLTFVVALFVSLVIQVPFEVVGYGSFGELAGGGDALSARSLIASSIGGIVAATLVEPFTAGVRALLDVDRRMRAEGLDVALAAAAAQDRR